MRRIFSIRMPVITTVIIMTLGAVLAVPIQAQEETTGEGDSDTTVEVVAEEILEAAEAEVESLEEAKLPDVDEAAPNTLSTQNLTIPDDQLALLVEPLTLAELEIEVEAWLYVLQARAEKINQAEIASRQEGQLLDDMANAEQQLEQAQTNLQAATSDEATRSARSEIAAARREMARLRSREAALLLDESFLEALADAEREQILTTAANVLAQAQQQEASLEGSSAFDTVAEAIEELSETSEDYFTTQSEIERVVPNTTLYRSLTRKLGQQAEAVAMATEEMAGISALDITLPTEAELEEGLRLQLVEDAARLTASRPAIVNRFQIVLDELERKGGSTDTYDSYIASVTGLDLGNVTDAQGLVVRLVTWLQSEEGGIRVGLDILKVVSILVVAAILAPRLGKLADTLLSKVEAMSSLFRTFIVTSIKRAIWVTGVLIALAALGIDLGPILAVVGGASFVLAFALQSNLGNFASGLMLLVNKPFDVGDEVKVAGYWANVHSISLASTKLAGFDGSIITLPNNTVWGGDIINYTHTDTRRIGFGMNFKFTQDFNAIKAIWADLTSSNSKVLTTPAPGAYPWNAHYDSCLSVWFGAWSTTDDFWIVYKDLVLGLQQRLIEEGIELAAPLQEIKVDAIAGKQVLELLPSGQETMNV